jgi:hypothetical protein
MIARSMTAVKDTETLTSVFMKDLQRVIKSYGVTKGLARRESLILLALMLLWQVWGSKKGDRMKPMIILAMIFSTSAAFADSFRMIKDGQEYLCSSTSSSNPGGSIDCVNKAYQGIFSREEAMRLCQGAVSTAPVDCALKAYQGIFSKEESIGLCARARSNGPVECALKAYQGIFSKAESLDLCSGDSTVANVECAQKAYAGPYSKEEAIRMCKANPQLMLRSLNLMQQSPVIQQKVLQMKIANPNLTQ